MKRDLSKLTERTFDLLIIGGGINGACAAWDATLRGLSVALVDMGDFAAATSANSLKIIHGGLRYLQQLDFRRMRRSIRERSTLMRIAPHLVQPMAFLMPTYGNLRQSRAAMSAALKMNDIIGFDRNRLAESKSAIPAGRIVSRDECLRTFPGFNQSGLTGGAVWYDCRVHSSERLTLSFLFSAARRGAILANYTKVQGFLTRGNRVHGVQARDVLGGGAFEIRADLILNASGPWVHELTGELGNGSGVRQRRAALALNLVADRSISDMGICFQFKADGDEDPLCRARFLFLVPWCGHTLLGTSYRSFCGHPDECKVREEDLLSLVGQLNAACPELGICFDELSFYHRGLLPVSNGSKGSGTMVLAHRHAIIDHAVEQGVQGILSVVGVKYTVARAVAQEAIDIAFKKLGYRSPPPCRTSELPIIGGDPVSPDDLSFSSSEVPLESLPGKIRGHLIKHYGSRAGHVAAYMNKNPEWGKPVQENLSVLGCEIVHAVREEMGVKLADVVFRRTELGTARRPERGSLELVARIMGGDLGWDQARQTKEVDEVLASYAPLR